MINSVLVPGKVKKSMWFWVLSRIIKGGTVDIYNFVFRAALFTTAKDRSSSSAPGLITRRAACWVAMWWMTRWAACGVAVCWSMFCSALRTFWHVLQHVWTLKTSSWLTKIMKWCCTEVPRVVRFIEVRSTAVVPRVWEEKTSNGY